MEHEEKYSAKNLDRTRILTAIMDIAFDDEGKPPERLRALTLLLELLDAEDKLRETSDKLDLILSKLKDEDE